MQNQHPVKILSYCSKNMWLLIFPLIRGLSAVKLLDFQGFYDWLKGAWFDIIIVSIILASGIIRWKFNGFSISDNKLVYKNGIFFKQSTEIPYMKITAFAVEKTFFLRFFHAAVLHIDTSSGKFEETDLKLTVSYSQADTIQRNIEAYLRDTDKPHYSYKPKWFSMIFFSFIFSSTLTGVIYTAVFFFKSGKIIEEILQQRMFDKFSQLSRTVAEQSPIKISPFTAALAIIFLGCWFISFITNIIRYMKFKISVSQKIAEIHTGIITKRCYYINIPKINYIDLRQSILTKAASVMSINVNCSGYGGSRKEIPVFIPLMHKNQVIPALKAMLPDNRFTSKADCRTSLKYLWRYIWKAVLLCVSAVILYFLADYLFPAYHDAYIFLLIMAELPSIWFGIVNIISSCISGVSVENDSICIKYSKGYVFHTVISEKSHIIKINISQTMFQKFSDTCDLSVYINSEIPMHHKVKSIKLSDAEKIRDSIILT
ncbi:MAG: PH domain-containing protein [Oscillospiraceae bacterium]